MSLLEGHVPGQVSEVAGQPSEEQSRSTESVEMDAVEGDLQHQISRLFDAFTLAAAGAILRAQVRKGRKAFMKVPVEKCGFSAVHQADEEEMLRQLGLHSGDEAAQTLAQELMSKAEATCGFKLKGVICPTPEQVVGLYTIHEGGRCCRKESGYPAKDFAIYPSDVVSDQKQLHTCHHPGECTLKHACGSGKVVMQLAIRSENVNFRASCVGCLFGCLPGPVVYHLTVSENGVARFHLSPDRWQLSRLLFAYGDSESCCFCCSGECCGCCKNLRHAMANGCFCLGLYFEEEVAAEEVPRVVFMRYNRWNGDLTPYWAGVVSPL